MKHYYIASGIVFGMLTAAPSASRADKSNAQWHMGSAVDACVEGELVRHNGDKLLAYRESQLEALKKAYADYQRYREMAMKDDPAIKSSKEIDQHKPRVLGNDDFKQQSFAAWLVECDAFFPKDIEEATAADKPKELRAVAQVCAREMVSIAKGVHDFDHKNAYKEFKEKVAKALKADPSLKETKVRLEGDDLKGITDPKLINATLYEWTVACDAWYPKAIASDAAASKKQDAEDSKWVAKLKGDRKRLQHEEGWPTDTSDGTDYAKMIHAKWWSFGSLPTDHGFACNEIFYFSGDKVSRRKTEGLCH